MAAGNWITYGKALENIMNNGIDLEAGSFRVALVTASYTPDQNNHAAWSDISASEVAAGGGYATNGVALGNPTVSSTGGNLRSWDADDVSWPTSTITAKYAVIVNDANADNALAGTDVPIAYVDLDTSGGSVASSNANFDIVMNAAGITVFTASAS